MNFASLDLNLLRVLDALLREGATTRAAQRTGLSQPAVSAALGRLRHALGDPLFVRRGRRLEPTDRARALEIPLREALEGLEALLSAGAAFDPATSAATFRIAGSDFFAELLMPGLATRLAREAPGVIAQLVDLTPENYIATLDRRAADIALVPRTDFPDWIEHRAVFRSRFAMIARRGHPALAAAGVRPGEAPTLDLFCDLGHVLFSPEGRVAAMGDAALMAVGRERRVAMTAPVFSGVCAVVAASDLVALLPRRLGEAMAPRLGLELYVPPMPLAQATICMVWTRRAAADPAQAWFRDAVAEALAPLDEAPEGESAPPPAAAPAAPRT